MSKAVNRLLIWFGKIFSLDNLVESDVKAFTGVNIVDDVCGRRAGWRLRCPRDQELSGLLPRGRPMYFVERWWRHM